MGSQPLNSQLRFAHASPKSAHWHNVSYSLVFYIAALLLLLEWQQAYKKSLSNHGSVSVEVTPCIIVGPSATGKSSLKHLLVYNTPKAVEKSTVVVATPEVVAISSEQYAMGGGISAWQPVSSDVMGSSLRACITNKAYDKGQYPGLHQSKGNRPHQQAKAATAAVPHSSTSHAKRENPIQKLIKSFERAFIPSSPQQSVAHHSTVESEVAASLDEEHSKFLHNVGAGRCVMLKDASFVHLFDTGGQPSFQDALPLLLGVPSTYIQVFNAASDLDQPVPVTYRPDDHTEEYLTPTTETGWEMMLRSFSSMHTLAHKSSEEMAKFQEEGSQLPQFRIFIVGTFKDQLVGKGRLKEAVQNISKHLRELEGKPYYHWIEKDASGQPFYLTDSMSSDMAYVNTLREHLSAKRSALKLKVPVMWYLCKQITESIPQKFIRFQDLKAFCLKHKFIDAKDADEQFRSLLKLFTLLGFYSFFDLKDVPDEANYVCTDKGVFVKEVSKLLAVQFLKTPMCHAVEAFKQDGIISNNMEIFEELGIIGLDRRWFLAALEHIGLLACYSSASDHCPSCFMPIVLPHGKTKLPDCSSAASLCVTFRFHFHDNPSIYTDLPQGVFCRLAVQLSRGSWIPSPKKSDRTTVKFHSGKFELYLTEAPGFISLTPVLVETLDEKESPADLHTLLQRLHNTLHESLIPSAEDVMGKEFRQTAEIVFGFECGCGNVPHLATPATAEGKSLICQATDDRRKSQKKEQIWFSQVDGIEVRS